ncbi:co-chaperone GroES [Candidatus Woesearchaeota archaeon]|jgi:chaperonin GroES|nr:co-chaperone GroES [Candidatus Woesearchaeota archaeon]
MLRPIGARVVVEHRERQEKTESGIIIPDTAREDGLPDIGTIVACGKGSVSHMTGERIPMEVSVGDDIYYGRFQAQELEYKGKKYLILGEQDIIAVIEEEE